MNREPNHLIAELMRLAGARDLPSDAATRRARDAAYAAWQRGIAAAGDAPRARSRRYWWPMALAASGALVAIFLVSRPMTRSVTPAARDVASVVAADAIPGIRSGMPVRQGDAISTGEGRAAFRLGDSLSLRADRHTRLVFEPDQVRLLTGRVYVDSGGLNTVSRLRIETPAGEVRHLGTQFLVTVEGSATRIRVREGRVALARTNPAVPAETHDIAAGDLLEVDGAQVSLLRNQPANGPDWEWATYTAPAFDIENRPLAEFLAWVAREHGWQIAYFDESIRLRAQDIRLHGSVSGLEVAAMLERVALITGVALRVQDGVLHVGVAG